MQKRHFKDFMSCAKVLNYSVVPFASVTSLRFIKIKPHIIEYKVSHQETVFSKSNSTKRKSRSKIHIIHPKQNIVFNAKSSTQREKTGREKRTGFKRDGKIHATT